MGLLNKYKSDRAAFKALPKTVRFGFHYTKLRGVYWMYQTFVARDDGTAALIQPHAERISNNFRTNLPPKVYATLAYLGYTFVGDSIRALPHSVNLIFPDDDEVDIPHLRDLPLYPTDEEDLANDDRPIIF